MTTVTQVLENWEQIKLKEKDGNKSVLSGVPAALPSVIKAYRIQDKARNVGFDWEQKEDVWKKVREELDELETELRKEDKENSTKELGDVLLHICFYAKIGEEKEQFDMADVCNALTRKMITRHPHEAHSIKIGKPLKGMTLAEMDALWNEAKQQEKSKKQTI